MCDINGIISSASPNLNWMQKKMTEVTNLENKTGSLADAMCGADIFVGVSAPGIVTKEMVASMNSDAILFAMAIRCRRSCRILQKKRVHASLEPDALIFQIRSITLSLSREFSKERWKARHTDHGRDETCYSQCHCKSCF